MSTTSTSRRLFVLGATGKTGREVLRQAKERGHSVTAFVRSPEKLGALGDGIEVVKGDPRSAAELGAALAGHDAVVSVLGPADLGPSTILGDAARSTVQAMQASGVRRLLVESAAMLFEHAGVIAAILRTTLLRHVAKDSVAMEAAVAPTDLEWTIVRPPRLTEGPLTNRYIVADGKIPREGAFVTSRADVAHFLLEEVERGAHLRRIVGMATRKN
jgi:putative NADH-flavin reductase